MEAVFAAEVEDGGDIPSEVLALEPLDEDNSSLLTITKHNTHRQLRPPSCNQAHT